MAGTIILIKTRTGWSLPSLSHASVAVEAYLRLANIPFAVQECAAASASPTGQLPALDTPEGLVPGEGGATPADEWAAAKSLLAYLRHKVVNLDRGLTLGQKAEALAFTTLVESRLQPALLHSTWLEGDAFARFTRPEYGASQAFPLSYLIARNQRRAVARQLQGVGTSKLYADAAAALDALANRLQATRAEGPYFFGAKASSIDALLFAALSFLKAAPVVHPDLRHKLEGHRSLGDYVNRLAAEHFSAPVPSAAEAPGLQWSEWGGSAGATAARDDGRFNKAQTEREREMQRRGRIWLACACAAIVAYVALSGQFFELSLFEPDSEYYEEEEDEE